MQSGINYYFNLLALDPSIFKVFYDSGVAATGTIPSISGGDPRYSGAMSFVLGLTQPFNGQNLKFTNETGLFSNDWTMFFDFTRTNSGNAILFSNYHGEAVKSGFVIGVNDTNRLYFETYSDVGPRIIEADIALAQSNVVAVTKAGDGIYFDLFDFNSRRVISDNGTVDSSFILNSSGWYLGDAPQAPSYFSGNFFRGTMNAYLYFSNALMPYQIARLFSGFFTEADSGSYASRGMDGIAFLDPTFADDNIEVIVFPASTKKTVGYDAVFDSAYGDFLLRDTIPQDQINSYVNGVAQLPSGYSISGGVYNPVFLLSGDYFISGQDVISNIGFGPDDEMIYDIVSGAKNFLSVPSGYTPSGGFALAPWSASGSHLFLNGVKLRSGIDFTGSGNFTKILNSSLTGVTGALFSFPIDPDVYQIKSGAGSIAGTRFARGTTEVWRNGIRQVLGINYEEASKFTPIFGSGTFGAKPVLFDNSTLFWN